MKIDISYRDIEKVIVFKPVFKRLIGKLIKDEGKELGEIAVIFTSNKIILEINREYLNHHYFTDVITFSYSKRNRLYGDIYVSMDQVKVNAKQYGTSFLDELVRVVIHGVLHLIGYEDLTDAQINEVREKEDDYLCRFKKYDIVKGSGT